MATNNYNPRTTTKTRFTIQVFSPQEKSGFKETEIDLPPGMTIHELYNERDKLQSREYERAKDYRDADLRQKQYNLNYATKVAEREDAELKRKLDQGAATRKDAQELRVAEHTQWLEQNELLRTTMNYFVNKRNESKENESDRKLLAINRTVYWPIQQKLNSLLEGLDSYVTEKPKPRQEASAGFFGIGRREEQPGVGRLEKFIPEMDQLFMLGTEPTQQVEGVKPTEADKAKARFGLDNEAQSAYTGLRAHIKMNIIEPLIVLRNNFLKAAQAQDTETIAKLKDYALQLRTNIAQQVNGLTSNFNKADNQARLDTEDKFLLSMIDSLAKQTMSKKAISQAGGTSFVPKTVNDLYQQMDNAFTTSSGKKVDALTDIPGKQYIAGYMQVEGKPIRFLTGTKRDESSTEDNFQWTPDLKKQYLSSELGQLYAKTAPTEKDIAKFLAQASVGLYGSDVASYLPSLYHGWVISRFKTNPEPIRQYIEKMDMKDALGYGPIKKTKTDESNADTSPLPGYYLNGKYHPTPVPPPNEVVETPGALSEGLTSIPTPSPPPTTKTRVFGENVPLEYQKTILGNLNKKNLP